MHLGGLEVTFQAMQNFTFHNPVQIVFGKGSIAKLAKLVPASAKVLVVYGGGSIKANGVYPQVMAALAKHQVFEFGGVEPNPRYETCMKAVELCRKENIGFLLSVGGGSVLDGTKFIAAATGFKGSDPWDILAQGAEVTSAIPLGCVLTLPATGSEMNAGAVVSRNSTQEKLFFVSNLVYPVFSILDPETTFTLPLRQTANGIVDAFVHTLEQYLTFPADAPLQDRQAEAILNTLIEEAPKLAKDPKNYSARANIMWCATQALNGNIGLGIPQDWSTHGIGHEITAFYGLDHAQTLAIIWPGVARNRMAGKLAKLVQYGQRVWGLSGADAEVAEAAIEKTEQFFTTVGCPTRLSAYKVDAGEAAKRVSERFVARGQGGIGERGDITTEEVAKIILSRR
jgi:NADP-dependent alcohol dehydrogenase